MRWILFLIGIGYCLNASGFDSSEFRYHKELKGRVDDEGLARFDLDSDILHASSDRFADLRVVHVRKNSETETPYLASRVDRYVPPESAQSIRTEIVSFEKNPDGSVEFTVRLLEKDRRCATLEFRTPLRDFEKNVVVQTSENGEEWRTLIDNALIFDHERFLDFRKTSLALPENDARLFRVRIGDATDEQRSVVRQISRTVVERTGTSVTESSTVTTRAFRIEELKFLTAERDAQDSEDGRDYPVTVERVELKENGDGTDIYLDAHRAPLTSLTIVSPDRNFRREVRIQIPDGSADGEWRTIKRGRIFRYRIGVFHDEDMTVEFGTRRGDKFRIRIENGDSPPLTIDRVVGTGEIHEVLFLAEPGSTLAVYYGSADGNPAPPRYDTAALILAKGREIAATRFTLGEQQENPQFDRNLARPGWADQRWVLSLVIALVVAGLVVILAKAGKGIENLE